MHSSQSSTHRVFPISRDPPEGGTFVVADEDTESVKFPISRDPPEGGTFVSVTFYSDDEVSNF